MINNVEVGVQNDETNKKQLKNHSPWTSQRIEYKIISLTKFSIPLSLRIYMTSYLFSLLTVTTHALRLMSL